MFQISIVGRRLKAMSGASSRATAGKTHMFQVLHYDTSRSFPLQACLQELQVSGTNYCRRVCCVLARKASCTYLHTHTSMNSAGARGQHRCNTRLGGWTQINIKERNREQSVIICVIVGDILNSGYMFRFPLEHACLRISTKPVDMPEDSIINVVANLYFFIKNEN